MSYSNQQLVSFEEDSQSLSKHLDAETQADLAALRRTVHIEASDARKLRAEVRDLKEQLRLLHQRSELGVVSPSVAGSYMSSFTDRQQDDAEVRKLRRQIQDANHQIQGANFQIQDANFQIRKLKDELATSRQETAEAKISLKYSERNAERWKDLAKTPPMDINKDLGELQRTQNTSMPAAMTADRGGDDKYDFIAYHGEMQVKIDNLQAEREEIRQKGQRWVEHSKALRRWIDIATKELTLDQCKSVGDFSVTDRPVEEYSPINEDAVSEYSTDAEGSTSTEMATSSVSKELPTRTEVAVPRAVVPRSATKKRSASTSTAETIDFETTESRVALSKPASPFLKKRRVDRNPSESLVFRTQTPPSSQAPGPMQNCGGSGFRFPPGPTQQRGTGSTSAASTQLESLPTRSLIEESKVESEEKKDTGSRKGVFSKSRPHYIPNSLQGISFDDFKRSDPSGFLLQD